MTSPSTTRHHRAIIGNKDDFWLYSSKTGFDLTRPHHPSSPPISPSVKIGTTTSPITIDPAKSALVIIDMQNYFLSSALGKRRGAGHTAVEQLVEYAISACRKAGIRIVWVNWGLTEEEVEEMPPGVKRAFGFESVVDNDDDNGKEHGFGVDKHGRERASGGETVEKTGNKSGGYVMVHKGVGSHMGRVTDPESGEEIDAGKVLMRGSWNTQLFPPLDAIYEEGSKLEKLPDVWIHKNRMSAMWGVASACEEFLKKEGIRTLLFSGVNTDQCVGGTYQDCFSKGYDCILLKDGCGTTSPSYAQQCIEYNAANTFGFVTTCNEVADGVAKMHRV